MEEAPASAEHGSPGAGFAEALPEAGLPEARLRIRFLNQSRELGLGALLGLAVAARVLGAPLGVGTVLAPLGLWLGLALALTRLGGGSWSAARMRQAESGYLLAELILITWLGEMSGAGLWLVLLFYLLTALHALLVLPARQARRLALLAAGGFSAQIWICEAGTRPNPWLALRASHPYAFTLLTVAAALDGYWLVGATLSQFSRMVTGHSRTLQCANQHLAAAGRELRRHRDHLEEMVRQRTRDLQEASDRLSLANQELRRLNQIKSDFLATMSHELRTPLTSIRSFSELLLDFPDEDVFTRCEFLEIIVSESDRLTRLISDVLDLAKIEANRMRWNLQTVRLDELVGTALEPFRLLAAHRGLQLVDRVPAETRAVRGDPDRLRQVLVNLLSNAVKFTPAGAIEVGLLQAPEAGAETEAAGEVVFYVADTGIGIPAEELERIFESFYQRGDALTDKPAGTGLGLAICRELMQHMGGRIWATSGTGQGSVFYCALPAAAPAPPEPLAARAGPVD